MGVAIAMTFEEAFMEGKELMAYFRDRGQKPGRAFIIFSAMLALQMAEDDDSPLASECKQVIDMMVPMFRGGLRKNYRFVEGEDSEPKKH